ncbi:hypothetical protein IWX47DRAFT_417402 [Phyllosticta citricarpa]
MPPYGLLTRSGLEGKCQFASLGDLFFFGGGEGVYVYCFPAACACNACGSPRVIRNLSLQLLVSCIGPVVRPSRRRALSYCIAASLVSFRRASLLGSVCLVCCIGLGGCTGGCLVNLRPQFPLRSRNLSSLLKTILSSSRELLCVSTSGDVGEKNSHGRGAAFCHHEVVVVVVVVVEALGEKMHQTPVVAGGGRGFRFKTCR